jgi:SOS-response transcriptional repressor LexA
MAKESEDPEALRIGRLVDSRRWALRLTKQQLADMTDLHRETVSAICNGRQIPPKPSVPALARCLGLPEADLVRRAATPEAAAPEFAEVKPADPAFQASKDIPFVVGLSGTSLSTAGTVSVPTGLAPQGAWAFRAPDAAMDLAGILPGDLVVVAPRPVHLGQDVVVLSGGQLHLRRAQHQGGQPVFVPLSSQPQPTYGVVDASPRGVVVGIVRACPEPATPAIDAFAKGTTSQKK